MPRESRSRRRSLGYRGFLSCEDPRGVVECGTIRKPKITPTQKEEHGKELESDRRKHKSLSLCSKEMEIGGIEEEECQSPTSFHLLEVSRGAQKLSNVINSWSSGHSKNNSRDLAQDLLEGAIDLGESLAMLSRFQQSPTKKHHKHKIDKAWFDDDDDDLEIEEKDFVEDMKKVIRNGLGRKHVYLSEEACGNRKLDAFDAPSTSSSQSSFAHSGSLLSPAASNKKNKKMKRPNLIAKLMGLEDASLRSLPFNPRKHIGKGEKTLKQKKTAFDRQQFNSEQRWNDEADKSDDRPPIVILRPSRFSCLDLEQPIIPKSRGEVFEEMFLRMNIRTNPLAQTDECEPLKLNQGFGKEVKEAKEKEKTKAHKKQFVEKKAEKAQRLSDSRSKGVIKGTTISGSRFQSQDGRKGTKNSGNSEKSLSKNNEKAVIKTARVANGNQRYRAVLPDSSRVIEDASQIEITDYADDDQSSPSETPLLFGNHCSTTDISAIEGRNVCFKNEERLYSVCDHLANGNQSTASPGVTSRHTRTDSDKLRAVLSSSQPFIKHVEDHFHVKASPDSDLLQEINCNIDHIEINAKELLDTAIELISIHGSRCSSAFLPLPWTTHKTSSITRCVYSSLEQLLDEVCDEIKALRRYTTAEGDNQSTGDSLLLLVKGDLRTTGMWDVGWTSSGSADELQELSREVVELILDGLIEEIFV